MNNLHLVIVLCWKYIKIHDDIIFQLSIDKSAFSGCPVHEKLYLEYRDIPDDDDDDITNHEETKLLSFDIKIIGKSNLDDEIDEASSIMK